MTCGRLLVAGLLGSTLIAFGGWGSGALPPGQSAWGPGTPFVLTGVLVLAAAWWQLRAGALRGAILWSLPLLLAPPLFSRDLYAYAGQAALVVEGLDPYTVGPAALPGPLSDGVDSVWRDTPSPYGPVWLALAGLVVRLAGDAVVPALIGLRLLAVLGAALLGWALLRLAHDPERALWLGLANPLVLLHLVGGGHNDALMIGLMAAGIAVAHTVRAPWALATGAVLVTLAALVKVPALVALAYLPLVVPLRPARLGAALVVSIAAVATTVVTTAASGLGWGWLGTLDAGRARLSLFSPLTGLGTALGAVDAIVAAGLVAAGLICAGLLGAAASGRLDAITGLGLTLLAVALLLPVVQPWYLLWGICLLAARTDARAVRALGAGSLVLCLLIAPSGRSVIRPPLYGLPTLLAAATTAVVILNRPGTRRES